MGFAEDVIESNGTGDIHWNRTIDDTFAFIQNNRPYYINLQTRKTKVDDFDFFKRLHECILSEISRSLKNTVQEENTCDISLLELFDLEEIDLTDEPRESFGDRDYLLDQLEKELNVQFNTRKQNILKVLYTYISQEIKFEATDCLSLFGTTAFNLVWEDVCSCILDNQLQKPLSELPITLQGEYVNRSNEKLIEMIDKPHWDYIGNGKESYSKETLEPDLISIIDDKNKRFLIFDAKYYSPTIEKGKAPENVPGTGDITKQYLYQLAYTDFLSAHGIHEISNCFLIPSQSGEASTSKGSVILKFLEKAGLENIQIRMLSAEKAYEHYLSGLKMDIDAINLDAPELKEIKAPLFVSNTIELETQKLAAEEDNHKFMNLPIDSKPKLNQNDISLGDIYLDDDGNQGTVVKITGRDVTISFADGERRFVWAIFEKKCSRKPKEEASYLEPEKSKGKKD